MRQPGDFHAEIGQAICDVVGGCLPLYGRVDSDDEFADAADTDTLDQALDVQVFRPDAIQWRKRATENVISGVHRARALQRPEIGYIFNDDDDRLVAAIIRADRARINGIDIAAAGADFHLIVGLAHGVAQRSEKLLLLLDEVKSSTPCGTGSKSRHFCQKLDEFFDFGAGDSFCHLLLLAHMKTKRNRLKEFHAMKLHAICTGRAEKLPGKSYKTGIFKMPVTGHVLIDAQGIVGDAICNRKHHGGVDQAIYIEGLDTLNWWSEQLGKPIAPGTFGENLVMAGLDNRDVHIGDRFTIDEVVLEATSARIPCATFTSRMDDRTFAKRYTAAARPGIYCRVVLGGVVTAGEAVSYQAFEGAKVTVAETMATFGKRLNEETRQRFLAAPIHYKLRDELNRY